MSSVGARLRQLRETRGMSLEEIARTTRVSSTYLHALETDDFAALPAPVFTRGFLRAYCEALGEAPEEALALYDASREGTASGAAAPPAGTTRRSATVVARPASESAARTRGPVLVSFVLLLVLGIALFAVTLALQSGRETAPERRAERVPTPPPLAPAPAGSAAAPPAPSAAPADPTLVRTDTATPAPPARRTGYRLVARAIEPTWIRVRTEDGQKIEETIPAGQVREWFSTGPFTLTVGNAGGIRLELNGRAVPPLGPSGAVVPRIVLPTESP